jgi:hypothetical protein
MTRRFLDDVRANIATLIADNTSGDTSNEDIRVQMLDLLDSAIQDECNISSNTNTGIVLTGSFQNLTTPYQEQAGGDATFLIPNFGSGTITTNVVPGFSYTMFGQITLEAANNDNIDFVIGINGVPQGYIGSIHGDGSNEVSTALRAFVRAAGISDIITIMALAQDGAAVVDVLSIELVLVIVPTNNP